MRVMLKAHIPVEAGNKAIKDGSISKVLGQVIEQIKPEATYFTAEGGERTAYFFFDLEDPSLIPSIVEPLFMGLGARIDLQPVMNPDELKKGLELLAKKS